MPESTGSFLAKKPYLETRTRVAGSHLAEYLAFSLNLGSGTRVGVSDVLHLTISPPSSLCVVKVVALPKFLHQWRSITSNRFVLSVVKGHHL